MTKKHIHKYQRAKLGKNYVVYRCILPDCGHYIRRELAEGKLSICNRCGEVMTMGKLQINLAKPHCNECTQTKKEHYEKIKEFVETLDASAKLS